MNAPDWSQVDLAKPQHYASFLRFLQTRQLMDEGTERMAVAMRRQVLDLALAGRLTPDVQAVAEALAAFCRNCEFVMGETPEEEERVARLRPAHPGHAAVKACYVPVPERFPVDEIRSCGRIADDVSRRVREMYEENPYPRWASLGDITPDAAAMDILVAGAGTGWGLLTEAKRYHRASVTGIDLSKASLAYALARAREYGITNIDLLQADILDVALLGRTFDKIHCTGVLHHMRDPLQGLRALADVLRPGGLMKLALYSRVVRRNVHDARALKGDLAPTRENIIAFRKRIFALPAGDPARGVTTSADFYSVSGTRDLLFHVQEHEYSPAEVFDLVAAAGLRMTEFGARGKPRDRLTMMGFTDMLDPDAWRQVEEKYPGTFSGMFIFAAVKVGS